MLINSVRLPKSMFASTFKKPILLNTNLIKDYTLSGAIILRTIGTLATEFKSYGKESSGRFRTSQETIAKITGFNRETVSGAIKAGVHANALTWEHSKSKQLGGSQTWAVVPLDGSIGASPMRHIHDRFIALIPLYIDTFGAIRGTFLSHIKTLKTMSINQIRKDLHISKDSADRLANWGIEKGFIAEVTAAAGKGRTLAAASMPTTALTDEQSVTRDTTSHSKSNRKINFPMPELSPQCSPMPHRNVRQCPPQNPAILLQDHLMTDHLIPGRDCDESLTTTGDLISLNAKNKLPSQHEAPSQDHKKEGERPQNPTVPTMEALPSEQENL